MVRPFPHDEGHGCLMPMLLTILTCLKPVDGQCMRSLMYLSATEDYQEFTSPGYPLYYYSSRSCSWRFITYNSTYAIRLDILDCSIEYGADCQFDYCQVFDGLSIYYASLGRFCGTSTPTFISTNDTMMLVFSTDSSVTSRGFKARYKAGPRSSLFDDEDTSSSGVVIGVAIGCVVFVTVVVVVVVLAYKHFKAKTPARQRPGFRPRTSIQVQPYSNDDDSNYYETHFPPAYEDIQASPPPGYSGANNYINPPPAAYPRRIDALPGYGGHGNEKAPWRKEPLDTMQGLDAVTNTRFSSRRETLTNIGNNDPHCSLPGASGDSTASNVNTVKTNLKNAMDGAGPGNSKAFPTMIQSEKSLVGTFDAPDTHRTEKVPPKEKITASNPKTTQNDRISSGFRQSKPENEMLFRRKSLNINDTASSRGKGLTKNLKNPQKTLSGNTLPASSGPSGKPKVGISPGTPGKVIPDPLDIMAEDVASITSDIGSITSDIGSIAS